MATLDYVVLVGYFVMMIVLGVIASWRIKKQEDYFMGGRSFGKLLQTFAAFGAGTGANDPIQTGRTVWTSGLAGIWSVLMWLFVTPFYWIFGVWYRRMRLLTLGDWFVERYQSQSMGAAYALLAFVFQVLYLSAMFSAIGNVAGVLMGQQVMDYLQLTDPEGIKFYLVPTIAVVVVVYGILGGLTAAYWTDLVQGLCIIALSVILIPAGLNALVDKYGGDYAETQTQEEMGPSDGFRIMHDRLPEDYFKIVGGPRSSEFPLHYIFSLTTLALVGIVIQPHFISTGGGSAKSEFSARMGLVTGNFLKRFCTIGWALTCLIVLALLASNPEALEHPDRVWGIATKELLAPFGVGLVGLMLACLLAALMSSADCYMIVFSALFVRNIYAPYFEPNATEKRYVFVGRAVGLLIITGAVIVSLAFWDVFGQFKMALQVLTIFAAPFWVGMFWRGGTTAAAWSAIIGSLVLFFVIPPLLPTVAPQLRTMDAYTVTTDRVTTFTQRPATKADVDRREAERAIWNTAMTRSQDTSLPKAEREKATKALEIIRSRRLERYRLMGKVDEFESQAEEKLSRLRRDDPPEMLHDGERFIEVYSPGEAAVFWTDGVKSAGETNYELKNIHKETTKEDGVQRRVVTVVQHRTGDLEGQGSFQIDFVLYQWLGLDLQRMSKPMLETLKLPPKIITPFLIMILISFFTKKNDRQALDRYYAKMRTPVEPEEDADERKLADAYAHPEKLETRKLFPGTGLEFDRPSLLDVGGFVLCFAICFAFVYFAIWLANIGSGGFGG